MSASTNNSKYQHKIEKVQGRIAHYSQLERKIAISRENVNGRYSTRISIEKGEIGSAKSNKGILHQIDYAAKYRIMGDIPSLTKAINSLEPNSAVGKVGKNGLKIANATTHTALRAAWKSSLIAETSIIKLRDSSIAGARMIAAEGRWKLTQKLQQSDSDSFRAAYSAANLVNDIRNGIKANRKIIKSHFKEKKKFRLERQKYKLQALELKALKNDEQGSKFSLEKKEYKFSKSLLKKQKFNQWRISELSRPAPLALKLGSKPISYGGKKLTASLYQKAVVASGNNDFVAAIDKSYTVMRTAKRLGEGKKTAVQKSLEKRGKIANKLEKKKEVHSKKLQKQEKKLQNRKNLKTKKKSKPAYVKNSAQKNAKKTAKKASQKIEKAIRQVFGEFLKGALALSMPVLIVIVLFFMFILIVMSFLSGIFDNSEWVLGTYTAQDNYLSNAEKLYTEYAYTMNRSIRQLGSSEWRAALQELGAVEGQISSNDGMTYNWDDEPVERFWGRSSRFDYDPIYDFDPYKLWSFMCAYYYNTDENGNIEFWSWSESNSDNKALIQSLFNREYKFEFYYDNASRWESLDNYVYFGGGSSVNGTYYYCENSATRFEGEVYRYRFKPISYTDELAQFLDRDGYCYITSNYRVLNANNRFALTGYYILDNRYFADGRGSVEPFYWVDASGNYFFRNHDGNNQYRSFNGWDDGDDAWFMIPEGDARAWTGDGGCTALYGYVQKEYWQENCRLYYNVKQRATFDEVIEEMLMEFDDGEERYELYLMYLNTTVGSSETPLRGNHQTFHSPLDKTMRQCIDDGDIINDYGYDMQNWGNRHCGLNGYHRAIDIKCASGSAIYAGMSGEICTVDTDNNLVVIRCNGYNYWYDGDGNGRNRDTKIYYYNVHLNTNYSVGDQVEIGDHFANSLPERMCHQGSGDEWIDNSSEISNYYIHIEIEYDITGPGWAYVDPKLLIN